MQLGNIDYKPAAGGRVSLDRQVLIDLRREQGLSQELFALMCAEQRLCVSIASIKRAETGKNIIYRTARDISKFFNVELSAIVTNGRSESAKKARADENQVDFSVSATRQIVVLFVNLESPGGVNSKETDQYWSSACKLAAGRYDAEFRKLNQTTSAFLFGSLSLMGYEHFQALGCVRWLQGQMHSLFGNDQILTSHIIYQDLQPQVDRPGVDDTELLEILNRRGIDQVGQATAGSNMILTDESVKQGLESRFRLTAFEATQQNGEPQFWLVNESQKPGSEVKRFIGRDLQVQQYRAAVESAYAYHEMQVVYVRGMAGIGKTRLMEEFCDHCSSLGIEVHTAQVLDFGTERNQMAIPKLIRSILGLERDETNLSLDALSNRFGQAVCAAPDLMFLYSWLNWPLAGRDLSLFNAMNHDTRAAGLQRVLENLIHNRTSQSPLLLCIEDLHWAGDDLLDSILQLAEALKDSQVILLLTSRQENDPLQNRWASTWTELPMLVMNLSPLRESEASDFADYFVDVPNDYKCQCIERAEGNPLFLEQLLQATNQQQESLPHNVQTLVLSRLDSLTPKSQAAARAASVLGQWFTEDALNHVLGSEQQEIGSLVENYLVKRSADRLQFVHALVHQGVYQTLTEQARIELHQRCAQWFESFDIALQARHLHRAKDDTAPEVFVRAIEAKLRVHDFDEVILLIGEALEIEYTTVDASTLWLHKGEAELAKGNTERAIHCYQQAIEKATTQQHKFAPLIGLANGLDTLERVDEALDALDQAEKCVSKQHLNRELSQIHYLRGNYYFPRGEVDNCRQEHAKALGFAQQASDLEAEAKALGGLGDAAYAQGKMMTALNYFEQCLALCAAQEFSQVEAANRFMLATTRIYQNSTEQALNDARESMELAIAVGHKRAEIVSRLTASWILLDMQQLDFAAAHIESGLTLAKDIGARRFEPFLGEALARLRHYQGDINAAITLLSDAHHEVHQQGIEEFIGPWVASSYALMLGGDKRVRALLDEGRAMLQQNCIGHNYYRFYVNAMESALLRQEKDELLQYMDDLKSYMADEPNPWAEYYLKRAGLLSDACSTQPASDTLNQLRALEGKGKQACLLHSLKLIQTAISELQQNQ